MAAVSVFVSYRRDDAKHAAGRLGERLDKHFRLFMDIDNIRPGSDFTEVVRDAVDRADILLAVIGPAWLTSADEEGLRRLDKSEDWVALEIGTALERGIRVIPVLVDGARMPKRDELPPSLGELAARQAISLSHESFSEDCTRLIDTIERSVVASEPQEVDLWADPDYPAAQSALLQQQWDRAIEGLERVLRRAPREQVVIDQLEDARRQQNLGELHHRAKVAAKAGHWGAAVKALQEIASLEPSDEVTERLAEAKQQLQVMNLQHAIRALADQGDWAGVLAADAQLSAVDPAAADLDGLAAQAREQLRDARLAGEYARAVQQLGTGEWEDGEATLSALLEELPSYRDAQDLLELARRRGKTIDPPEPSEAPLVESTDHATGPQPDEVPPPTPVPAPSHDEPSADVAAGTEHGSSPAQPPRRVRPLAPLLGTASSGKPTDAEPPAPPDRGEPSWWARGRFRVAVVLLVLLLVVAVFMVATKPWVVDHEEAEEILHSAFPVTVSDQFNCESSAFNHPDGGRTILSCLPVVRDDPVRVNFQVFHTQSEADKHYRENLAASRDEDGFSEGKWGPGEHSGTWGSFYAYREDDGRWVSFYYYDGTLFAFETIDDDPYGSVFDMLDLLSPAELPQLTECC